MVWWVEMFMVATSLSSKDSERNKDFMVFLEGKMKHAWFLMV